jgi:hypothetical protein
VVLFISFVGLAICVSGYRTGRARASVFRAASEPFSPISTSQATIASMPHPLAGEQRLPSQTGSTKSLAPLGAGANMAPVRYGYFEVWPESEQTPAGESKEPFDFPLAKTRFAHVLARLNEYCNPPGGPTGGGRVVVEFSPDGSVRSAEVVGGPFDRTPTAECVAWAFTGVRVPPFAGGPLSVTTRFRIAPPSGAADRPFDDCGCKGELVCLKKCFPHGLVD